MAQCVVHALFKKAWLAAPVLLAHDKVTNTIIIFSMGPKRRYSTVSEHKVVVNSDAIWTVSSRTHTCTHSHTRSLQGYLFYHYFHNSRVCARAVVSAIEIGKEPTSTQTQQVNRRTPYRARLQHSYLECKRTQGFECLW